ncbi:MAG: glycoside hydrolase family 3 C-terminal domain-containing protein [Clostridiales bacterium]|nr:glycoside hydrolase family 3 C-terminal domain-containing protein [Clostridiales bacterium]
MNKFNLSLFKRIMLIVSRALAILMSIIFGVLVVGTEIANDNAPQISAFLGQDFINLVKNDSDDDEDEEIDADYFTSEYESVAEVKQAGVDMTERVMAEGAVLLYNKDNALPLNTATDKVSMFSASSANPVWSGSRESYEKVGASAKVDLKAGLENAGLKINDELYNWYKSSGYGRKRAGANSGIYEVWNINDAPWSAIGSAKTKAGYNTAMFVVSRIAGEGFDTRMRDLGEGNNSENKKTDETNGNYLLLSRDEKDVFKHIKEEKEKGTFDKFIVLLNTTNQVAIDFIDEYDVDAVLYSGSIGSAGANAIGKILTGEVNPSGKLSDTFWKNHYLNPVLTNWGQMSYDSGKAMLYQYVGFTYDNSGKYDDGYVVYQEGIYSGYRYTETRYEDVVMGTKNAGDFNYSDAVAFPFGYGISYTEFEYSGMKVAYDGGTDSYVVSVDVKNAGQRAGKNAVQLFLQKPYTAYDIENGVEKAAVEFVAFDKTDILEPGASETVTMTVARRELASYDSYGKRTYILEQGDYYLTVASDAHAAINNILAKKGYSGTDAEGDKALVHQITDVKESELLKYAVSETGKAIVNQFDNVDLKLYSGAGANKDAFEYITRSDWAGTVKYAFDLQTFRFLNNYVKLTKTSQIAADSANTAPKGDNGQYPTYGSKATAWQLIDMRVDENGEPLPYDHPRWEELLDQLTFDDMAQLIEYGFSQTRSLPAISNPGTYDYDSDLGVITSYSASRTGLATKTNDPGKGDKPALYLDNGVVAATRNAELCYEYGVQWGEDCLWAGYQGLYGTGANIHRSPYLGRTYGYFSEDPVLTGRCVAQMNIGMESKGAYMLLKHCVLNEQECNRCGGASWANEQTIREIYLKAFGVAIQEGGVQGVMTSLNRLGAVPAPHHPFINEILRGEFGMRGYCVTDSYMGYMNIGSCVLAGNDLPLAQDNTIRNYKSGYSKVAWAMRDTVHNILYSVVHSSAMNGFTSNVRVIVFDPEWKYMLDVATPIITSITWVCIALFVAMEVWSYFGNGKRKNKRGDGDDDDESDEESPHISPDEEVPIENTPSTEAG